jgi:hypothetical protein
MDLAKICSFIKKLFFDLLQTYQKSVHQVLFKRKTKPVFQGKPNRFFRENLTGFSGKTKPVFLREKTKPSASAGN